MLWILCIHHLIENNYFQCRKIIEQCTQIKNFLSFLQQTYKISNNVLMFTDGENEAKKELGTLLKVVYLGFKPNMSSCKPYENSLKSKQVLWI